MRHLKQKVFALVMAVAMTLSLTSVALAADFSDMPTGWSKPAMEAAVQNGLLSGANGKLNPQGKLTRMEMATIVVRAFGASVAADISGYTDVPAGAWYADAIAKAAKMGVISGSGNSMAPSRQIQRQEAFLILARALKLNDGTAADLSAFSDASQVASWAVGGVSALVKGGYVNGSNGKLNPTGTISREEFAQVMYNLFSTYITKSGEVTSLPDGNVIINTDNVTLKGVTVKGDLIIGDGVGEGDVTLDNVTVNGRMVVRGGGVNSIHIVNSTVSNVLITKTFGAVRVVADTASTVSVTVTDTAVGATIEGSIQTLTVATTSAVTVANASVATVAVTAANANLSMTGTTTVSTMSVNVSGVTVNTGSNVTITTMNTSVNVVVTGGGEVKNTTGSGSVTDKPVTPSTPSGSGDTSTTTPGGSTGGNTSTTTPGGNTGTTTPGGTITETHTHTWETAWAADATSHWHNCTLHASDPSHTDKSDEAAHTFGDTKTVAEGDQISASVNGTVTTLVKGDTYQQCSVCSFIKVINHTTGSGETDPTTCEHTWVNGTCSKCSTTHTPHDWTKADGVCTVCGYVCTHGSTAAACPTCGKDLSSSGETHQHNVVNWDDNKDGKTHSGICVVDGCTLADKKLTEDHDTNGTDGACSKCGYKASGETPDHEATYEGTPKYVSKNDGTHTVKCTYEGCTVAAHDKVEDCTNKTGEAGSKCDKCEWEKKDTSDTTEHNLTKTPNGDGTHNITCSVTDCDQNHNKTNEDCTNKDSTSTEKTTCTVCGWEKEGVSAPTHNLTKTPNNDGTHNISCSVSDCSEDGHNVTNEACTNKDSTSTEKTTCTVCGWEKEGTAAPTHNLTKTPNNDGTHNITCSVSDCSEDGHNVTNEDCTNKDSTSTEKTTCTVCGWEKEGTAAPTHNLTKTPNNDGTHNISCSVSDCSEDGHTVTNEACTFADEEATTACSVCGGTARSA